MFIFLMLFLSGCKNEESKETIYYKELINELSKVNESSLSIPVNIEIKVEEMPNNFLRYTALLDRNGQVMKDIEAILIHDKETDNVFPSLGIFEDKITLNNESKELGIKLTGYVENGDNINFKFLIKYKNSEEKLKKYYYVYNYRQ